MKSIGWRVAELWPFEVFQKLWPDIGDRTHKWFYILSPMHWTDNNSWQHQHHHNNHR